MTFFQLIMGVLLKEEEVKQLDERATNRLAQILSVERKHRSIR